MPLALAAGCALDVDAATLVGAAAGAGFDAVGLRALGQHAVADPDQLRALAAAEGVAIHDVEVHRIGTDSDPTELFETAAALGATAVLVVSDLADLAATTSELERLVLHADRLGLAVGLEYMAWTTPSTAGDALAVARRTGCRLVVDVLHHHRTGAGAAALREIVDAGVLGWLQLCDAPAAAADDLLYEARHDRLPPGHGELPLAALLGELPADVTISVEVQSDHLAGAHDALARARLLHTRAVRALNHRA